MNCPEVRENLAAWLDGEIEGAPRRAMDDHFASCAPCAAERRAQAAAWALLDHLPAGGVSADPSFRDRVMDAVRRDRAAPAGRVLRLPLPFAAAAAAAILAAAGGAIYFGGGNGRGPSPDGRPLPIEVSRGTAEPPAGLLDDMAVLESLDLLQDDDLRLLDRLAGYDDEDLAPFGG